MLWSYRGADDHAFNRVYQCYLRQNQPDIFVVMETRINHSKLCKKFKKPGFVRFYYIKVRRYAGRIVIGWKMNKVELPRSKKHFHFCMLELV